MALHNFSWVIPNLLAGSALPGGRTITGSLYRESDLWDLREEGVDVVVPLLSVDESFQQSLLPAQPWSCTSLLFTKPGNGQQR